MRPVLLEMTGFASFRDPTRMSFADADYFALVGPTGAGKSTVIDALTFALYGSVARWDREGMVSPALAPTTNRGTVRLLFDVAGDRYSVVRELRRSGGKQQSVNVRSVRLERLRDPRALGGPDDDTEVVSADSAVTPEVERLLGLTFKHFCTCVALPQGAFAEFLHAKAFERQKILMKLLGLEVYERIQGRANELAKQQSERAKVLTEQLGNYADATEDSVAALADRLSALVDLRTRTEAALPGLRTAAAEHDRARDTVDALTGERDLLASVRLPDGIGDLEAERQSAVDTRQEADAAVTAAERADTQARAALRAGPDRHALELISANWQRLADVTAALPSLEQRTKDATDAYAKAERAESDTVTLAEQARDTHAAVTRAAAEVAARAEHIRHERDLLGEVRVPAGLSGVAEAAARAASRVAEMTTRLGKAERADAAARAALATQPDAATLSAALDHATALATFCADQPAHLAAHEVGQRQLADASAELAAAEDELAAAQQRMEAADRADRALALRAHLHVGAPCPVCTQEVRVLPEQNIPAQLRELGGALALAKDRRQRADKAVRELERTAERDDAAHSAARATAERHRAALAGAPVLTRPTGLDQPLTMYTPPAELTGVATATNRAVDALTSARNRRSELVTAATGADAELAEARQARSVAQDEADEVEQAVSAARARLRAARDPLVALGAPAVNETDVNAGWAQLTAWAATALAAHTALLAELDTAVAEQANTVGKAATALSDAEKAAKLARAETTKAGRAEQTARTQFENAAAERETLAATLADAPSAESAAEQLGHVARLQQAADDAEHALSLARKDAATAREGVERLQHDVDTARRDLARARDPLVRLGAPPVDDAGLLAAWSALSQWAHDQAAVRERRLDDATATAEQRATALHDAEHAVVDDLAEHDVLVDGVGPGRAVQDLAAVAVAAKVATAQADHQNMMQRLGHTKSLTADIDGAQEQAQVAKQLADLMRSNQFPRWLVASALDALVEEASVSLLELSGGQFELTHADGDFLVIDHNEADIPRPVKTLSGGETFQASLALALALSSQLGVLAAAGATRLESIFLDEGFGTLDEATLDTVASTLENLAGSGSRMVGVITHVAALAERVPVRFQVNRDANGSHVTREGT